MLNSQTSPPPPSGATGLFQLLSSDASLRVCVQSSYSTELWQHYHVEFQSSIIFFKEILNLGYGSHHTCHTFPGYALGVTGNLIL